MSQPTTSTAPTGKSQDVAGNPSSIATQEAPIEKPQGGTTTPPGQATTWADKVRVSSSSSRHTLEPLPQKPAGSRLKIPAGMVMHSMDQWRKCIIGFFIGCKMHFHAVSSIAKKAWKTNGMDQVTTMADGFYVFRFRTEEAVGEVLERGPWMFGGKNIILQKWSPKFQFDKSRIAVIPVWVRLRGLPLPLWTKQGLSLAASMVGTPLSCDEPTISCSRLDYARLCIELNASLPIIHQFEIESSLSEEPQLVKVDYEWKPPKCDRCQCFGHNCVAKEEQLMKLNQKEEKKQSVIPPKEAEAKEEHQTKLTQKMEIKQTDQVTPEAEVSNAIENKDHDANHGKQGQDIEDGNNVSLVFQANTSSDQHKAHRRQDKPNDKTPQLTPEASCGSNKATTEPQDKTKWTPEDEEIISKLKGKAPAISEPTIPQSPVKVKKKKGGKKKQEARGL
ncbi:hypothetical protein DKX38_020477 [Salix brachista]|uniref:DUF4283 domain-containing protein n=1 Tax=Salix brachista TaxID=2182728 RepID=A0A5N5KAD0_9ROSI|nr:hypothetical protein DKX38_020477 [Salix brachista]